MAFYVVVTIVSAVTLTADMILRYMEGIKSFGLERRFHHIRGKTIPIEDFLPANLTMAAVFLLAFGITGMLLAFPKMNGFVAFPIAVLSGAFVHFFFVHFLLPRVSLRPIPKDEDLSACEAVCTEPITPDGYGSVRVTWKKKEYTFPAVCANEKEIEVGEKVAVLYREDGVCFVERDDRIMNIIDEKEESEEN